MKVFNSYTKELVDLLNNGAVGVLPTDTVYGLVCQAANQEAVSRLYKLKSREHKPGTIIAANIDQLVELGIKYRYLKAVEGFWPNSISIIIPAGLDLKYIHRGLGGIPIRIPDNKKLNEFLKKTGPLLTTSANHPGQPTADNVKKAKEYFKEEVYFYVDGGELSNRQPSTIIRIVDDAIEVVREGAVKISEAGRIEP